MSDDNTKLVQTKVNDKLDRWLKQTAKSEGISVAAYVRRLIMRARTFDAALDDVKNQASK